MDKYSDLIAKIRRRRTWVFVFTLVAIVLIVKGLKARKRGGGPDNGNGGNRYGDDRYHDGNFYNDGGYNRW